MSSSGESNFTGADGSGGAEITYFQHQQQQQFQTPLQPHTILLKDGETVATMYPVPSFQHLLPKGLLSFLLDEFNMEVVKGDSFPYYETLTLSEFKDVWLQKDGHVCVMVLGEIPELDYSVDNDLTDLENNYGTDINTMRKTAQYIRRKDSKNLNLNIQWEKQCLGIFSVHPAYPGRSSHVATGTFLVNAGIRGKGIGKTLVEEFIEWSPRLGYTSSYFPLIYGTNVGMRQILEGLNFKRIGVLPESGILKGFDVPIDSFIYGKEFTHITRSMDLLRNSNKSNDLAKYERLQYYLETGKYPLHTERNEKARLRVTAKTHQLLNGKLMFRGKEVVYDPEKQRQIVMDTHLVEHGGINKITTKVGAKYHWKGIKSTVCEVIAQCTKCKMRYQDGTGVIVDDSDNKRVAKAHMLPNHKIDTRDLRRLAKPDNTVMNSDVNLSEMAEAVVGSLQNQMNSEATYSNKREYLSGDNHYDHRNNGDSNRTGSFPPTVNTSNSGTVEDTTMNSFDKFVQQTQSRKKSKHSLPANNNNIINDTILSLEDNVMAALEMVHDGGKSGSKVGDDHSLYQQPAIDNNVNAVSDRDVNQISNIPLIFDFGDDYLEEEDEDYEEPTNGAGKNADDADDDDDVDDDVDVFESGILDELQSLQNLDDDIPNFASTGYNASTK
ncbi:Spt10p KNAG_0J02640 [Huiozyma naganishii CBS 8797]|uniref:N-acetyltransferase domain-containing protein n=1 Tax=Huiozyma naganishii (strain ATCC MYA-139 / BCRC 22969 / CBS 8797 / KCTC 17520 / NBRC 10181 / NCYC 3082 / Yp74L-3) TaxID=1071383 RepID=J7RR66_HUIN7|nr:hypothetical protein KNAG_0J02640 [Kazachstania naganishii CBS 8797]CCK72343.1 hypothetical protein KNAG_0J02640 [Kazachstania naganishii CBS 8797]